METFWRFLYYKIWMKFRMPFEFIDRLISEFLWDMYWYKYVIPKTHKREYIKTPLRKRIHNAWWYTKHGEP